jgi:GTP-binding protein
MQEQQTQHKHSIQPVFAIVGRPNVGKSTLFNCLTKSRDALVANFPGLTRDRQYGYGVYDDKNFIVIDTGGIGTEEDTLENLMANQSWQAITEANVILFLVDAREGLTIADELIAQRLRMLNKPLFLVLNKIDGLDANLAAAEFHALGFGNQIEIAAAHRRGINNLLEKMLAGFAANTKQIEVAQQTTIKIAIIGRPNVGKSTLVNRILGEERVVVYDEPGTTRDSIFINFTRRGKDYIIIDTAGVRRRSRVTNVVEKFSVIKTLQAIAASNVVVFLIDATTNIAEQDLKLLGHIVDSGKSLVLAVNKWDGLAAETKEFVKQELQRRLVFLDYVKWHFISALHGSGVGNLFTTINKVYASAIKTVATSQLNTILAQIVAAHPPPLVKGKRVKLRYVHLGGHNPPIIVIHGKQVTLLPASYKRYLANAFREALKLIGTPVRIELREG